MTFDELTSPLKRADAQRNRAKILDAARAAFAIAGAQISMAEISRRADVGMATLYRNFPGRRELLEALYTDEVDAICDAANGFEAETPGVAFVNWLNRFYLFLNSKRHVGSELLKHSDDSNRFFSVNRQRVLAASRPLFAAAQSSEEVREDVTLEQVLDLVAAVAHIPGEPQYIQPILQTVIDGLLPLPR
jgi:AcrR family transcriptional regulator